MINHLENELEMWKNKFDEYESNYKGLVNEKES